MKIRNISAEKILNSKGEFTISVTVTTDNAKGKFSVPSGASTGAYEAHEIKNVARAMDNIHNIIAPKLIGFYVQDQRNIDDALLELDGTDNKEKLGGNAIIGTSIACAMAAAKSLNIQPWQYLRQIAEIRSSRLVPFLFFNLINGGRHARTKLPFQEYLLVPQTQSVSESLEIVATVSRKVQDMVATEMSRPVANIGDEGGVTIDTDDVRKPLEILAQATRECGYSGMIKLAMDVAASTFYMNNSYQIGEIKLSTSDMLDMYSEMVRDFNIMSIEDPFEENDFASFSNLKRRQEIYIVGDDLTVTNPVRLKMAIKEDAINGVIIKPNQIGTLSETIDTIRLARDNNIECIVSHRSGETDDYFIADLAYAYGCFGLKSGAPNRAERLAKYNRLLHISNA